MEKGHLSGGRPVVMGIGAHRKQYHHSGILTHDVCHQVTQDVGCRHHQPLALGCSTRVGSHSSRCRRTITGTARSQQQQPREDPRRATEPTDQHPHPLREIRINIIAANCGRGPEEGPGTGLEGVGQPRARSVLSNSPAARRSMTKSLVIERRAKGNRHCSAFSQGDKPSPGRRPPPDQPTTPGPNARNLWPPDRSPTRRMAARRLPGAGPGRRGPGETSFATVADRDRLSSYVSVKIDPTGSPARRAGRWAGTRRRR